METVFGLLGGLAVFLFGMNMMSESLQKAAGAKMKSILSMLTSNPVLGVLAGAVATAVLQSSSATTVMAIGFVSARLMTLRQAIAVIFGANIGTTMTAQLMAFKLSDYIWLIVFVGFIVWFAAKDERVKNIGQTVFAFGLLFVGIDTMGAVMKPLAQSEVFLAMIDQVKDIPALGVAAGTVMTLVVQSSSATIAVLQSFASQPGPDGVTSVLGLQGSIPILLGDNIGTTITAVLASIGTDRTAKQACAAHVLFNVIGVCIFLTLLPWFQKLIALTADGIGHQIANAHTLFNVLNTLIFLPFVRPFAALIRTILPDAPHKAVEGAQYLDPKLIQATPGIAVEAVKNECAYMGFLAIRLLDAVQDVFFHNKKELIAEINETEAKIDDLHRAIKAYAEDIMQAGISDDASTALALYVGCSRNVERIADQGKKLIEYYAYRQNRPHDFSEQALTELSGMYAEAHHAIVTALDGFINEDPAKAQEVAPIAGKLRGMEVELRNRHIQRLDRQECDPETGLVFVDILGVIEHIGYHSNNLAKATITTCSAFSAKA